MLQREKIDLSPERRVLSNLIMSTRLLARCRHVGDPSMFESTMSRAVATWVWDFYDRTGEAPGKAISDIYRQRARELRDADAELVFAYLETCSDEWLPTNDSLAEEMAVGYFQGRSLSILNDRLTSALRAGDTSGAFHAVAEFTKPGVRVKESVSILRDSGEIAGAFEGDGEEIFKLPGELGRVIGPFIEEDFAAFIAPPKRGKTWWLMATAVQATLQGHKVLFVSLEMSKRQMTRRFWQMLTGTSRYGEEAPWPIFESQGDGFRISDGKAKTRRVDASPESIQAVQEKLRRVSHGGRLELRNFPTGSLSVRGLEQELKDLEVYENFCPDVIVVDYADIMDLGSGDSERDKLNRCWKSLRGLASSRKCVVVTASQTGRETVGGEKDAKEKNVAEDIRKLAHVTKMITINQTEQEQARGIYRISCNTTRDGAVIHDQVVCTYCLAIGRPFLECQLLSRVDMSGEVEYRDGEEPQERPSRNSRGRSRR